MKSRFYGLAFLLALCAFMSALVLTAQQEEAAEEPTATAPARPVKPAAETADVKLPDVPKAKAVASPSVPVSAEEAARTAATGTTVKVEIGEEEFAPVLSATGEPRGTRIAAGTTAGRINLTFDDVELIDVAKMFTKIADANIMYNPTNLRGRVTVNFTDVEWKPALESILEMHQLCLRETLPGSGVYTILPKPVGQEPLRVETYFLKYATVAEVQGLLTPLVGQTGTISPFPSRNALVVRTTSPIHGEIKQIIERVDKLRDQVFIEAKFLELSDEAIRSLGIHWKVLEAYSINAAGLQWNLNDNRNWTFNRTDSARQWDRRSNLDTQDERYENGAAAAGSTLYDAPSDTAPGINSLSVAAGVPSRAIVDSVHRGKTVEQQINKAFDRTLSDMRAAVLGAADFALVLSALKQLNGVSIISNPKIIVANEQSAVIHIGTRERPFIATVTPATQMSAPIVTYNPGDPVDLGVKVTVTPTVNTASNITVKIEPELTRFVRDAVAPNGQTYPIIATKSIKTIFCLESGKTVAIGGLTETDDRDEEVKVPLLGDIPIIGKYLFTYRHKGRVQQETIIFVTVGLAVPENIQTLDGLPENTQLVNQHMVSDEVNRAKFEADMRELREAAQKKKERNAAAPTRLLRRSF